MTKKYVSIFIVYNKRSVNTFFCENHTIDERSSNDFWRCMCECVCDQLHELDFCAIYAKLDKR